MLILALGGIGFYVGMSLFRNEVEAVKANATYSAYEAVATAAETNVDTLKNRVLEIIYKGAMNPTVLLQNIEAVKSEVNNYTTQITNLATERAAGRIPASTMTFYLNKIAEEISKKLSIELRPHGYNDYYGGYDGGTGYGQWPGQGNNYGWYKPKKNNNPYDMYGDLYRQYLQYYMMQQMMNPYSTGNFYSTGGGYPTGQPNYGYSYGYGYQSPNMQPVYPTQQYQYYPQNTPYYGGAGGYPNYGGYY